MNARQMIKALAAGVAFIATVSAVIGDAQAQEKHKFSYKLPASAGKYPQQYSIDVGDVPGHAARIYEIERAFPPGTLAFEGVSVVRERIVGYSDYVNTNGPAWAYGVYYLEDGNKVYARASGASQTTFNPDGTKNSISTGVANLTGGTGKFKGIRGSARFNVRFDPAVGRIDAVYDGEYWMED